MHKSQRIKDQRIGDQTFGTQTRFDNAVSTSNFLVEQRALTVFQVQRYKSGKKYTVHVGDPHKCSCRSQMPCLHFLHIMVKVLKVPMNSPLLWTPSCSYAEISRILQNQRESMKASAEAVRQEIEFKGGAPKSYEDIVQNLDHWAAQPPLDEAEEKAIEQHIRQTRDPGYRLRLRTATKRAALARGLSLAPPGNGDDDDPLPAERRVIYSWRRRQQRGGHSRSLPLLRPVGGDPALEGNQSNFGNHQRPLYYPYLHQDTTNESLDGTSYFYEGDSITVSTAEMKRDRTKISAPRPAKSNNKKIQTVRQLREAFQNFATQDLEECRSIATALGRAGAYGADRPPAAFARLTTSSALRRRRTPSPNRAVERSKTGLVPAAGGLIGTAGGRVRTVDSSWRGYTAGSDAGDPVPWGDTGSFNGFLDTNAELAPLHYDQQAHNHSHAVTHHGGVQWELDGTIKLEDDIYLDRGMRIRSPRHIKGGAVLRAYRRELARNLLGQEHTAHDMARVAARLNELRAQLSAFRAWARGAHLAGLRRRRRLGEKPVDLQVHCENGRRLQVKASPLMTFWELKRELRGGAGRQKKKKGGGGGGGDGGRARAVGRPRDTVFLFEGRPVDDRQPLCSAGVARGHCVLFLVPALTGGGGGGGGGGGARI